MKKAFHCLKRFLFLIPLLLNGNHLGCTKRSDEISKAKTAREDKPVQMHRELMGTHFQISVYDENEDRAKQAMSHAFEEMERLELVLSEWKSESEISQINRHAGLKSVKVSEDTLAVIEAGLDVSKWSGGAFDLTWATLHGLYDFRRGKIRIAKEEEVKQKLPLIDWKKVEIDSSTKNVQLVEKGMKLGTGSIAKGYALDRASDVMRSMGIKKFMLFGGGQVQVHGKRGNRPWRIGVQHPRVYRGSEAYFAFIEIEQGSVSTSGDYEHAWVDEKQHRWHHILDLKTGRPSSKSISVTVVSPLGIYADALSTAVFLLGPKKAEEMFKALPFEADFLWVGPQCEVYQSAGLKNKIHFRVELKDGKIPFCLGK